MTLAKEKTSSPIDEPNVVVPFASSYNTRGIDANTNLFTSGKDQLKINSIYEVATNEFSGSKTHYLVKRPGVAALTGTFGATTQVAYLNELAPGALAITDANHWVISVSGNDKRASDTVTTTVIDSTAGYLPVYIDKTMIGTTDTAVLQTRHSDTTSLVFYSSAIATWTQISDGDFTSLVVKGKMEYLDGYAIALTSLNRLYNSNLNSLANWDPIDFLTKQIVQDTPVALARLNKLIVAFGMSSLEVFHDVGNASGSPLENLPEKALKGVGMNPVDGAGKRNYYCVHNNVMYFVGNNPIGVYAYNGERLEKVSTSAIDKVLASGAWYNVCTVVFSGKQGVAIAMDTVSATTQDALIFFPEWKDWFQWQSTKFQPVTSDRLGNTFLGIGASSLGHTLYKISETSDNFQDAGVNYTQTHQFVLPSTGNHIKRMPMCGVIGDTAGAASSLAVSWSDDDGVTFNTPRNIDMTGKTKKLHLCGSYRDRTIKLTNTANIENRLEAFVARVL